jgi:hypothetical protein
MALFAVECAVDHVTSVAQGCRQLTIQIRIVFNNKQAHP